MNLNTTNVIREMGHQVIGVLSDGTTPSFCYSIGLSPKIGFELIMFGADPRAGTMILNDAAALIQRLPEHKVEEGKNYTKLIANYPARFHRCNGQLVRSYVVQADAYYGYPVPVMQLVVPDKRGLFPDSPAYDHTYMDKRQPLLYNLKVAS